MDIHLFQTFIEVARLGSFAAVARNQHTDPSVVSRQIAALEKSLGYRLFDRTTRRLALTEAGQLTLTRIKAPLDELIDVSQFVKDTISTPQGSLRITTSIAFAELWLMPRIKKFEEQYPLIALELVLSDSNIDLDSQHIDLAIRLGSHIEGSYVSTRLFPTHYRVVASPEYLQKSAKCHHPADLSSHRCLVFSLPQYRNTWRYRSKGVKEQEIELNRTMPISNALVIRRAALEGLGVAMLSNWTIDKDIEAGNLVDIFPEYEFSAEAFDTAVWAIHNARGYMPAKIQVFIEHLLN